MSNFFENFLLLLIPVALTRTFGVMVGDKRQGYAILATMTALWGTLVAAVTALEVHHSGTALQAAGASMEGKETRFGEWASACSQSPRPVRRRARSLARSPSASVYNKVIHAWTHANDVAEAMINSMRVLLWWNSTWCS